jgi:hypothetical protein
MAAPGAADAATIDVISSADSSASECTLRGAIVAANTNTAGNGCAAGSPSGTDSIDFGLASGATISLATALPIISSPIAIAGPGASQLTVSGNDAVRVFNVTAFAGSASISGLTIAHGSCLFGCGVNSEGTLALEAVRVEHNTTVIEGGASSFPQGGGIRNAGAMTLVDSMVSANTALGKGASGQNGPAGAGIYNSNGSLTLDRSTVSGNSSIAEALPGGTTNAIGGGISNNGTLVIERSTISGNSVSASGSATSNGAQGGGILNANSPSVNVTIDRSTIAGNSAAATGAGASATVGGFNVFGTTFTVTSSTITGNSAANSANVAAGAVAKFKNTIVAAPLGGGANCGGVATSLGYNLTDTSGCGFTQLTDKPSTDPMLAPAGLTNNGGPTPTIALLEGSPAIDQGLSTAGEVVDQRGLTRPVEIPGVANAAGGDGTDIGAFEVQLPVEPAGPGGSVPTVLIPTVTEIPKPTVDTTAPRVTLRGLKAKTAARSLRIRFVSSEAGSTFRCKLDRKPYRSCRAPFKTGHLAVGAHSFSVIATDRAGNAGKATTKRFRVLAKS